METISTNRRITSSISSINSIVESAVSSVTFGSHLFKIRRLPAKRGAGIFLYSSYPRSGSSSGWIRIPRRK